MSVRVLATLFTGILCMSCRSSAAEYPQLLLRFLTHGDPGVPVSGVALFIGDRPLGVTVDGVLETVVDAYPDRVEQIRHACPPGHQQPPGVTTVRIAPVTVPAPGAPKVMEIQLRCPPSTHIAVFVLRIVGGAFLPVLLDGVEVARTDRDGTALFSRNAAPGTTLSLEIDTSSDPSLRPRTPRQVFEVGTEHTIFTFDRTLARVRPTPRRRPRPRISRIE